MSTPATGRWLLIIAGIVIVAVIGAAFAVTGMPSRQRMLREDERRIADLQQLQGEIEAWVRKHDGLPRDLAQLADRPGVSLRTRDPFTAQAYEYRMLDARRYQLCAEFTTDTADRQTQSWLRDWRHARGRQCFERRLPERNDHAGEAASVILDS